MVARRAVALVCVAVVLLTGWVPAVTFGRQTTPTTERINLCDNPTAPLLPAVFDQLDRVIPSLQKIDPAPGHVSWLVIQSHPIWLTAVDHSRRCFITDYPDTLQKLHCCLSV